MKVYLDDLRSAPKGYVLVKNVNDLKSLLRKEKKFDVLSLDNDLGEGQLEGYDFVKWYLGQIMNGKNYHIKIFKIHSANVIASNNMKSLLMNAIDCGIIDSKIGSNCNDND